MEHIETVIIGAGQAGLSTAYHLKQKGRDCVVLDRNQRIGDGWRQQWDSLRLYTPAKYDGLPGMPFPGEPVVVPGQGRRGRLPRGLRPALGAPGPARRPGLPPVRARTDRRRLRGRHATPAD